MLYSDCDIYNDDYVNAQCHHPGSDRGGKVSFKSITVKYRLQCNAKETGWVCVVCRSGAVFKNKY